MSRYAWKRLSFEPPPGMVDETVVTFVEDPARGSMNVTLTSDVLGTSANALDGYVASQLRELGEVLDGYTPQSQVKRTVGQWPAIALEHSAAGPEGGRMYQFQVYVKQDNEVVVVTGTGAGG